LRPSPYPSVLPYSDVMRESLRLAIFALITTNLCVFVVVPAFAIVLRYDGTIFPLGGVGLEVIVFNSLLIAPTIISLHFVKLADRRVLPLVVPRRGIFALYCFVIVWVLVYLFSGGLDYRQNDVDMGYASRSASLRFAIVLGNLVIITVAAILIEVRASARIGWAGSVTVAALILAFAMGGSRGLVVQLLLTVFLAFHLQATALLLFSSPKRRISVQAFRLAGKCRRQPAVPRVLTVRTALFGVLAVVSLSIWGVVRDGHSDALFATLHRAAEPYWHHALVYHRENGSDLTVLLDVLSRIASIPGRWFGIEYGSSIDGAEVLLESKLGIMAVEGVSLPITYLGEGFLFAGYQGAFGFQVLTCLMVFASFYLLFLAKGIRSSLFVAFVAFQVVKTIFLYPKSMSGVFLVLFYEGLRDYLLLLLLSEMSRIIPERARHKDDLSQ
jgi:hypothetical protein